MRRTVTLTPEVRALIDKEMRERGLTFKEVVNDAIIRGLGGQRSSASRPPADRE
jgi:hypothetical protein